jgi:hypothetical protein
VVLKTIEIRIVAGLTIIYAISGYHHLSCEIDSSSCLNALDFITTLCEKVCQWQAAGRWFSPGIPIYTTNKGDRRNIPEILLKVALNTMTLTPITNELYIIKNVLLSTCSRLLLYYKWSLNHHSPPPPHTLKHCPNNIFVSVIPVVTVN